MDQLLSNVMCQFFSVVALAIIIFSGLACFGLEGTLGQVRLKFV
jgi:hypothetical protein